MISRIPKKTLKVIGSLIKNARRERHFSQDALAERLNVTRQTVMAIEKGDHKVAIGTFFEAAYLLGIPLLSTDEKQLTQWQSVLNGFDALLPKKIRKKKQVSDDF